MVRANKSAKRSRFTLKKKRNWSVREKLMVLHFLNGSNSVCATARYFDLQPNQVRDWRNKKDQLKASAPHLLKLHSGR